MLEILAEVPRKVSFLVSSSSRRLISMRLYR